MALNQVIDHGTRGVLPFRQFKQLTHLGNRETKLAGMSNEGQPIDVVGIIVAI
jgi:hypothetical protein